MPAKDLHAFIFTLSLVFFADSQAQCKIYNILPSLKYQLSQLNLNTHAGSSLTHTYIQKTLANINYSHADLSLYIKKLPSLYATNATRIDEYAHLVLKSIELEKQFSDSHYSLFHGTLATKLIILRTMLEQARQEKNYEDFFLLRNKGTINHLKGTMSGYRYATEKINSIYTKDKKLGCFDNYNPLRSDLLSVNTTLLANAGTSNGEDSISHLYKNERFMPSFLREKITECLRIYELSHLPIHFHDFLNIGLGSLIVIMLPKHLASLSYVCYPFGVPRGLPSSNLLQGKTSFLGMKLALFRHKEITMADFFAQQDVFHQVRLVLNPDYFEETAQQIKMFIFVLDNENTLKNLQDNFTAIKSIYLASRR